MRVLSRLAVVAATVAIWLALTVSKPLIIFASALVMGVAVNGMHFTGMTAMSVREDGATGALSGASASTLLVPIGLAVIFGVFGLVYALIAAPTDEDRAAAAYLATRQSGATAPPAPATGTPGRLKTWPEAQRTESAQSPQNPAQPIPTRQSKLNGGAWTYRDRTPR